MKIKNVKIDEVIILEKEDLVKEITISDSDLLRMYAIYKNIEIKDGDKLEGIIKIGLPVDSFSAKTTLMNGKLYNNKKYISLLTTAGMMKKEDSTLGYKCEYFFIVDEDKEFINVMESVASLGKLKEKEENKEMLCINKDVVSRLSLLTSSSYAVNIENYKIAILPEMSYTYVENYLQFKEVEVEGRKVIDLKNIGLEKKEQLEVEHTAMDGSGFMMDYVANDLQKQLNLSYKLDWCGIRQTGVATKGLVVRFDWKKFLKEVHNLNSLIVKDFWGNDIDLFKVDIVLNSSQVKWAKWFKSYDEIIQLRNKEEFSQYKNILNSWAIAKTNKDKVKDYSLSNYQILSNLNLTPNELNTLAAGTEEIYAKIIDKDIDAIRISLGDIARDQDTLSASTKIHKWLQLDEKLINIQSAKTVIESMVNKKVHQLAGGRLYLKGNYKTSLKDPISYFESLMENQYIYEDDGTIKNIKGRITENGLKGHTNYVANEEGKRVLARCPLNSATEIIKTTLSESEIHKNYLGNLSNELIFYAFDDNMMKASGQDEDMDAALCIENDIIYNAVIDDIDDEGKIWYFRNQFDGVTNKVEYTKSNLYDCVLATAGNSIGKWANEGAKISNFIQELPYQSKKEKNFNSMKTFSDQKRISCDKKGKTYEEFKADFDKQLNEGLLVDYTKISEEDIKKSTYSNFQNFKAYSYYTLYLQMVAIDQVKTCIPVSTEETSKIKVFFKNRSSKKTKYMYHAKYTKNPDKKLDHDKFNWNNSLLNNYSSSVIAKLGWVRRNGEIETDTEVKEVVEIKKDKPSPIRYNNDHLYRVLDKASENLNQELLTTLTQLENVYHEARKNVSEEARKNNWNDEKINIYKDKIDLLTFEKAKKLIISKYDYKDICKAIAHVRRQVTDKNGETKNFKMSCRFIIMFLFEEVTKYLTEKTNGVANVYQEDENGEIDYFFKKWTKKDISISDENLTEKEMLKKAYKIGQVKKLRAFKLNKKEITTDKVIVKGNKIYDSESVEIGTIFDEYLADLEEKEYDLHSFELAKTQKSITINIVA